jgi:hypothetical protein
MQMAVRERLRQARPQTFRQPNDGALRMPGSDRSAAQPVAAGVRQMIFRLIGNLIGISGVAREH